MSHMHVLILVAHPDPTHKATSFRFADSAKAALEGAGHEVRYVNLMEAGFNQTASQDDFKTVNKEPFTYPGNQMVPDNLVDTIKVQQENLKWSTHVLVFAPLWFGRLPACFYAYTERVLSVGFAWDFQHTFDKAFLAGRKVSIIVSAGSPPMYFDPKNGNGLDAFLWSAMYGFNYAGFTILRSLGIFGANSPKRIAQQPELQQKFNEKFLQLDQWKTIGTEKLYSKIAELEEVNSENILL
ncbi:Flavodoxin-like fold family protein [Trichomonas vaginalis G3]|uniref:Flavodoxin-like fold family protein n=1 Tax=Trichomonas vaginalis (strain ATCC PRA-98 / G3) TaxID=412133 RepID=A2GH85_TRIV3|nr:flavodoxin-like fold family protein [Trichomonas vaginalis G3]XP_051081689.1 flavodoxin-like fold family protein [Trichomonas vaginalis G3]EAX83483.1 Flavodoxin-like fold family protein [Trichomonas vaginalis G3]KAI5494854.1 flavodoxin-like fold family protein [Trichomonas vaginalis G3]KAI5494855.1 flavodoxin-like fold family protein [Trichomonas vaginalis G3]|eukprot:XP_001296413.1 Flavodoxin-like fold family protein [Trichomonas vaginalis G3]